MTRFLLAALAALTCSALLFAPGASARTASSGEGGPVPALRSNAIAPQSACPNQDDTGLPVATQLTAMLCMTNYARAAYGLRPMTESKPLARAAVRKSSDMLTCGQFSHEACGREFTYWMGRYGYTRGCWAAAENIAWGTGSLGSVGGIFRAWMQSPGHRENILGPYSEIGISFATGNLEGNAGAAVWTQDFGSHGC